MFLIPLQYAIEAAEAGDYSELDRLMQVGPNQPHSFFYLPCPALCLLRLLSLRLPGSLLGAGAADAGGPGCWLQCVHWHGVQVHLVQGCGGAAVLLFGAGAADEVGPGCNVCSGIVCKGMLCSGVVSLHCCYLELDGLMQVGPAC